MNLDFFIPLLTYPDRTPADGLLRAVDFAATLGGRLSIATHAVDVPRITNPLASVLIDVAAMSAAAEAASRERGEDLATEVANLARRLEVALQQETLTCRLDTLADRLAELARTHDVSLVSLDPACAEHVHAAEALIFGSGGPVALFPSGAATHFETVTIAWDGGRTAARAIRDALPILRLAKDVVVLTVSDDKQVASSEITALRAYLDGHAVESRHRDVTLEGLPIGDVLQSHALAHDSGLLIMGAYGHSRIQEFVLGGATRGILTSLRLPIFMSH